MTEEVEEMARDRDSQVGRVYNAERAAFGTSPHATNIGIDGCQEFLNGVLVRPWLRKRWGVVNIDLVASSGGGRAVGNSEVRLGPWGRTRWVALHELAHLLVHRTEGWWGTAGHGPEFAGVYLYLVGQVLGRDMAQRLREEYRNHRVRYTRKAIPAPTKREATVTAQRGVRLQRQQEPLTEREWVALARLLDRAIKSDALGASGSASRTRALATRRDTLKVMPSAASERVKAGRMNPGPVNRKSRLNRVW